MADEMVEDIGAAVGEVDEEEGNGDESEEMSDPLTAEEKAEGYQWLSAETDLKAKGDKPAVRRTVSYKFFVGNDIDAAIARYGKEIVYDLYESQVIVKANQRARREMSNRDKTIEAIQEFMESYTLEPKQPRGFRPIRNADAINHLMHNMDTYADVELARVFSLIQNRFPGGIIPPHVLAQLTGQVEAPSVNGHGDELEETEELPVPAVEPVGRQGRRNR